jgi:excinuclease ABC subunit C
LIAISKGHNRDYKFDKYHTLNGTNISLTDQPKIEGFLQKIRDKAHTLSKKNSLKRMSDSIKSSFLDDVKGIGKVKKLRIINYFGSTKELKQTSMEELLQIEGVNTLLAQTIIDKINNE